jgi:hypothetical protein
VKPAVIALALLACAGALFPDDGTWMDSRGFTPSEGPLYSIEGSPDIALEKEYLELVDHRSGTTRAVFLFTNLSKTAVTVECAFPVVLELLVSALTLDPAMQPTESRGPSDQAGWDFGAAGSYAPQVRGPYPAGARDWLDALGVPVEAWEPQEAGWGGTFIPGSTWPTGRQERPAAAFRDKLSFSIRQDGKDVPVGTCVVEFGDGPERITLHFRHQLRFGPGASSKVEVAYESPAGAGASGGPDVPGYVNTYEWSYILSTGASWKGPIGTLVLAVPPGFLGEIPPALKPLGSAGGRLLYQATGWEPKDGDNLDLSWSERAISPEEARRSWLSAPREITLKSEARPAQGVRVLGASSFLPDKADVYTVGGVIRQAPFDPARLFDGILETCWVEGKSDDGIGEYVTFALDVPMYLAAVQNGFLRSSINLPEKDTAGYYEKNNRVKTLEIRGETGGLVATLELADVREVQYFTVALAPGTYRAAIAAVYPGTRWKDTCLGELTFFPGATKDLSILARDAFFLAYVKP